MSKSIKGNINIHTENIFPIIKKWLYSEHDIFVRELISNSFDAINKLKKISNVENIKTSEHRIEVIIDKDQGTLTFRDTGLGMSAKEVQKYITQIAFSGAEDFLKKYTDSENKQDIIGHFGMGFYSAFMVADQVEIKSKSYQDVPGVHWTCKGDTEYEMVPIKKETVGTDIILTINEESKEFLEEIRIETLIKKYANFLPIEIKLNDKVINDQDAGIWVKTPQDCKDEDYKEFYKKLFPFQDEPLFWIHLNVDYPFRLQGILYFPKVKNEMDLQKDRIKLFCQQVFVTDNAHDILPEFLMMLQGVIDCPDFPLNVSRSALQNDPYMQKISKHIIKKIADKISQLYKKSRTDYEGYWPNIHPFVKYGMMNNDDFYTKTKDAVIFESSNGGYTTLSDYLDRTDDKKTVIYSTNKDIQGHYIEMLKAEGKEVLLMDNFIDTHFIQFLEMKESSIKYSSVDGDAINDILSKPEEENSEENKDEKEKKEDHPIATLFKNNLNNENLNISITSFKSNETIALIKQDEQTKRLKEMSRMMGSGDLGTMFNNDKLLVNENHPTIQTLSKLDPVKDKDKINTLCEHIYDLALVAHGSLDKDKLPKFIKRSQTILEMLS